MKTKKFFQIILLLFFSININAQIPPYVPTNGLVGWWPFTGNANDLSGNGNNGTNNGATLTTDRFANTNSSYIFNNNYIITSFAGVGQNVGRAFSLWTNGTNGSLLAYGGQFDLPCPPAGDAFQIIKTGNLIEINVDCSSWIYLIPNYSSNTWYHFVFSFPNNINNLNGVQVYCNSNLLNVNSSQGNGAFSTILDLPVNFGRCHRGNNYYNGKIDDIGAWNRALSSCEINQLYTASLATISIVASNSLICAGQNATLNVGGANTYTWANSSNLTSVVVSPSVTMAYSVAGTNSAGCTSTSAINLTVNPNPIITVNNGTICAGQNFTINPNGANTYTIQGGNAVVSPAANTSYTVAGTSAAGCVSQALATSSLIVNPNPIITVNNGTICVGQNFTINPNGANTYTIQGGNPVVSPPSNAIFTVSGTSAAGCLSQAVATSSLIVNPNPTITVNNGTICAGQNFTINPNGANTYTIQGGSAVVSPPSNASFTVSGTSGAGCVSQAVATSSLIVNPNPTITVNNGTICVGQNFTINPNGANTYTIQGGNAVVSPPSNTSFTVIGTNSVTGCRSQAFATSSLIVNQNPTITVNNGAICAGQNFTINPNGANTYTIQGGNAVVSPSINTTYSVIGTNTITGCLSQAFATSNLTVNPNPTVTVNSGAICIGESFTISPNGANTYTIQGANAVVSPSLNSTYTVAGTNTAGCVSQAFATSSITVNECVGIINQNIGLGGVSIYPNPNKGEFTIELTNINNSNITITNVLGQIIKTQKAELINQINLNLFEKGVYFISVMDNNQSVYRGSIIKE